MENNLNWEKDKVCQPDSASQHSYPEKYKENTGGAGWKRSTGSKVSSYNGNSLILSHLFSLEKIGIGEKNIYSNNINKCYDLSTRYYAHMFDTYSIKSSSDPQSGKFITELIPNSVAHNSGLRVSLKLIYMQDVTVKKCLLRLETRLWKWTDKVFWTSLIRRPLRSSSPVSHSCLPFETKM